MKSKISSKYYETKERLWEKIRNKTDLEIKLVEENRNYVCYFCLSPIKGKTWKLKEKIKDGVEVEYCLDNNCYQNSKRFVYYKGIPLSLN